MNRKYSEISLLFDNGNQIITKKSKQKLSIIGKSWLFLYKATTGNKISGNAIFKPLKSRLHDMNGSYIKNLTTEELFYLKLHISSYLKYLKPEEKVKIIEDLINQIEKIEKGRYDNQPILKVDNTHFVHPETSGIEEYTIKKKKSKTTKGRLYTHVSVFEELSDYKEWLNIILDDANSASYTKSKTNSTDSQFQLDLNVQQFAALFYFLNQEKILIIPEGKKREFAKSITSVFHTKGQKNVSIDSFVNKFSKPEIEAAEYWSVKFVNMRIKANKIN